MTLAAVVALGLSGVTLTDIRHMGTPRNALTIGDEDIKVPYPPASDGRILDEVSVSTVGDYTFMFEDAGAPIRFDPCRAIPFVINPAGSPPGGDDVILEAVRRVSATTGLSFEYEGYTDEVASFDRLLIQPDRYGERFAPFIIGWSDGASTPELADSVTGLGGSTSVSGAYGPDRFLVGGVVILDGPDMLALLASGSRTDIAVSVAMHEVAHVVGLGHVENPAEIMNATNTSLTEWGPGDLAGLAIAGAGPCQDI